MKNGVKILHLVGGRYNVIALQIGNEKLWLRDYQISDAENGRKILQASMYVGDREIMVERVKNLYDAEDGDTVADAPESTAGSGERSDSEAK